MMNRFAMFALLILVAGCGDSSQQNYDRGYEEGYNDGQYEVCRELESMASGMKSRLRNCRGT